MKIKFLSSVVLILISIRIFGQLEINAGNDTVICVSLWGIDTAIIGGEPTAFGGLEPYVYSWEANCKIGSKYYGASYFLDDTTKANPKLIKDAPTTLIFKLTVKDNNNILKRDSVNIRFSRFGYTMADYGATINQGDTVTLMHNVGLGIKPLRFAWTPNYNISDTSHGNPEAWPDKDTDYKVIVTDSAGCKSIPDIFEIIVKILGNVDYKDIDIKSYVFPNPIVNTSMIYINANDCKDIKVRVLNANGQIVLFDKIYSDYYEIGNTIIQDGLYYYLIFCNNEIISIGQFVKR